MRMDESRDFVTQKVSRFIGYSYPKTNAKYFMRIEKRRNCNGFKA